MIIPLLSIIMMIIILASLRDDYHFVIDHNDGHDFVTDEEHHDNHECDNDEGILKVMKITIVMR